MLKTRLDELEKTFSDTLEEDIDNKDKLKEEIKSLNNEINTLKFQLDAFTKKSWFLSLSTRIFGWLQRNPESARRLMGATRELLPQEVKDTITQEAINILLPPPRNDK